MKRMRFLVLGMVTCLACTLASPALAGITNGGFESGLAGWTAMNYVYVVGSYGGYSPTEGNLFAQVVADGYTSSVAQTTFSVPAGAVLSFDWFFQANDYLPFNDYVAYQLTGPSNYSETLASVGSVGNYGGTPWTQETYTIPTAGNYTFTFSVTNYGDTVNNSVGGLDNVKLTETPVVPEPMAMVMVMQGVGMLVLFRKRLKSLVSG